VRYLVLRDLVGVPAPELQALQCELRKEPFVLSLLADVADFHEAIVQGHKNPSLSINHLLLLQSLDLGIEVPQIDKALSQILARRDEHGVYKSHCLVPTQYGGNGKPDYVWALCDAPLVLLGVFQAGFDFDLFIRPGLETLMRLQFDAGFPCAVSKELGSWRGPGRKADPCPIATLWMLRLFAAIPDLRESPQARALAENMLSLWENSLEAHPYMFFMGTDFRKL
jgi:hypothetical protein